MTIRAGDPAFRFALPAKPGEMVDVGECIGRDPVVLLFIFLAFSPVCTAELCRVRDTWDRWKGLNTRVFGISVDSPFATDRFRQAEGIPFPILSDFNRDVSRAYGVLHDEFRGLREISKRSVFVIARDGTVAYDWVSDDPGVEPDYAEVEAAVREA